MLLFIKSTEYILSLSELLSSHTSSSAFNSLLSVCLHNHSITIGWERSNWFQMLLADQFIFEYSAGDPVFSMDCLNVAYITDGSLCAHLKRFLLTMLLFLFDLAQAYS